MLLGLAHVMRNVSLVMKYDQRMRMALFCIALGITFFLRVAQRADEADQSKLSVEAV